MAVAEATRRWIALVCAAVIACKLPLSEAALDSGIVPSRFLTARSGIGTDPLFLYYFPECVTGGTTFADSIIPSALGTLSSPTTPVCPSNNGFTNSNNGVVVDGTRSLSLSGFVSSNQISGTITDFSLELWVRTDSALDVASAQYVLFEIGESTPGGSGFGWGCGSEYVARLVYFQSGLLRFEFEDSNALSCALTDVAAAFTFTQGQLYHIVVTVEEGVAATLYADAVSLAGGGASSGGTGGINFGATTSEFVYVGDSPGALSTSGIAVTRPWDGEILMAAFYDIRLTQPQISSLLTAFLPNHRPAVKTSSRTGQEDANLTISFTSLVDYYDEDEKSSTVTAALQFLIESTPSSGFLFDDTGVISVAGGAHTVVGTLQYGQNVPNLFNFTDSFTYSVDDQIAAKTAAATMNLFIGASNDIPVAENIQISTPAFQIVDVVFQGSDNNDCSGPTCEGGFEPQSMQVQVVGNSFGQLKRVNGGTLDCTAPLGADITNGQTFTLNSQGQFLACYEAAGDDTINANGIVGIDSITYTVSDAFETSPSGTVTVTVTSVLSVANTLTHVQTEDEVVESAGNATGSAFDKTYAIDLIGIDNKCDDVDITGTIVTPKVGVSGCPRQKEYVISPPLPSTGTLLVDDGGSIKAITDADLVAEGFYLIPGNGSKVLFLPNENFFNAAPHPLCKFSLTGADTQISRCAVGSPYLGPACVGPFCADGTPFTTLSFNGTFGFCSESTCPAEINYRLKIGLAISEEDTTPDIQIFVKSTLDRNPLVFFPARSLGAGGTGYGKFDTPLRTDSGDPMVLDPLDQDQRIVGARFLLGGAATQSKIRVSSTLIGSRPTNDDLAYDNCFFQGCDKDADASIFTFPSQMNEFLAALTYSHIDNTKNLEENLSVFIRDRYLFTADPPDQESYLYVLVLNFAESGGGGGGILSDIQFIAIASSVGLLILMCLISYCGCLGTRARNMTRSCLQVQSLLTRDNEVPHTEAEKRKSLRHSRDLMDAEKAMRKEIHDRQSGERCVLRLLWCASVICPCCCKYEGKKLKLDEEETERRMIGFLEQKLAHPPKEDDETHVVDEDHWLDWRLVYDEQDHPFWWNQRTGQSQWYSPFPEGHPMLETLKKQHLGLREEKEAAGKKKAKRGPPPKPKKSKKGKKRGPPPKPKGPKPKRFDPAPPPPKGGKKLDR